MMDRACHKMISPHINDLKQDFHTLKLVCDTLNRSRRVDRSSLANHTNSTDECEISADRIENTLVERTHVSTSASATSAVSDIEIQSPSQSQL